MNHIVYRLKLVTDSRFYFGSTHNLRKRCAEHSRSLMQGIHDNADLQEAFDAIPESKRDACMQVETIGRPTTKLFARRKEDELIQKYKPLALCYNRIRVSFRDYTPEKPCKERGCGKKVFRIGLCGRHFREACKRGDSDLIARYGECSVKECHRVATFDNGNLCHRHFEAEVYRGERERKPRAVSATQTLCGCVIKANAITYG